MASEVLAASQLWVLIKTPLSPCRRRRRRRFWHALHNAIR